MRHLVNSSGAPSVAPIVQTTQPADGQAPQAAVSAPAAGATVSGGVALSASASDNVGVAGLQFQVDGSPVGAPITFPPYNLAWDSSTVLNGTHTITARASDSAGNSTASAGVSGTVA